MISSSQKVWAFSSSNDMWKLGDTQTWWHGGVGNWHGSNATKSSTCRCSGLGNWLGLDSCLSWDIDTWLSSSPSKAGHLTQSRVSSPIFACLQTCVSYSLLCNLFDSPVSRCPGLDSCCFEAGVVTSSWTWCPFARHVAMNLWQQTLYCSDGGIYIVIFTTYQFKM